VDKACYRIAAHLISVQVVWRDAGLRFCGR